MVDRGDLGDEISRIQTPKVVRNVVNVRRSKWKVKGDTWKPITKNSRSRRSSAQYGGFYRRVESKSGSLIQLENKCRTFKMTRNSHFILSKKTDTLKKNI